MHHTLPCLNALTIVITLNFLALPQLQAASEEPESPEAFVSVPSSPLLLLESDQHSDSDAEAVVIFYMAVGAWIAILTAATLAIVIMAHRIAVAQRIRPSGGNRLHTRNSL